MINNAISRLHYIVQQAPGRLREIGEQKMAEKPFPNKWSKKEIIGHLIDSATNNHHRFVRGQYEFQPEIRYDQNHWNACNHYQQIDSTQLIAFWALYNQQLLELIKQIPEDKLERPVKVGEALYTLSHLFVDYVEHLEHHLRQVTEY